MINRHEKFVLQTERCCPYCGHDKLITVIQDGVEALETCDSCSKTWEIIEPEEIKTWSDIFFRAGASAGASSSAGGRAPFTAAAFEEVRLKMRELLQRSASQVISDTLRSTTVEVDVKRKAARIRFGIRKSKN